MTERRDIALLSKARKALAEAHTIGEVKAVRDQGQAAIQWAKSRRDIGLEARNDAAEIVLEAERRLGDMLAGMEFDKGGGDVRSKHRSHDVTGERLSDLAITKMQSSRWQAEARVPEGQFKDFVTTTREAGKELTSGALVNLGRQRTGVEQKPWEYAEAANRLRDAIDRVRTRWPQSGLSGMPDILRKLADELEDELSTEE